jgi:hypothetical protein
LIAYLDYIKTIPVFEIQFKFNGTPLYGTPLERVISVFP